jgi:pilus assembly protein CpaB
MVTGTNIAERMRSRKTLILALAGGILGVTASVMAYHYLEREEAQFREQVLSKQSHNDTLVVVAKADLAAGTALGEENMATRHVPKDYVYPETVLPENFSKISGQTLIKPLSKGQPLLSSYLSEAGVTGLSDKVKEGRRAVTINVDEVSSVNGMIHPGDRIDLLFSVRGSSSGASIAPLLQNVWVLATGSQYAPANGQPGQDKFGLSYATLTLDVTPEEAERIILARETGILTATLRGRNDALPGLPTTPMTASQLFGPSPAEAPWQAAARVETVTYIVRGNTPGVATIFELPVGEFRSRGMVPVGGEEKNYPQPDSGVDQERTQKVPQGMEQNK